MLAPEFFPVWGGTGSYTIELLRSLPSNVNIHIVTLKRSLPGVYSREIDDEEISTILGRPLEIHYISNSSETFFYNLLFQVKCLTEIPKLNREFQFDIIHSHLCHMPDVFLQLSRKTNVPTVLTIHGTIQSLRQHALIACSNFGGLESSEKSLMLYYPIIKFLQNRYVQHISRLIAVSQATKRLATQDLNIPSEKINVVYNGIDTNLFDVPSSIQIKIKYSKPKVVYVGRLIAKKSINTLINAIPQVLRRFPETEFLFVGGGSIVFYRELLLKMGVSEKNFSFTGQLGYFERAKILQEATVFVNPSFFENCSISILEAMSCGCAVIACNVGGNPEIIDSKRNGLLVSPFDSYNMGKAIISLLEDEFLNREISRNARVDALGKFSTKKCAQETYKVYEQVLSNNFKQ
jgi:glycosyltransferase involved in cell wall biosynthesis